MFILALKSLEVSILRRIRYGDDFGLVEKWKLLSRGLTFVVQYLSVIVSSTESQQRYACAGAVQEVVGVQGGAHPPKILTPPFKKS